jgi:hypothetical protein
MGRARARERRCNVAHGVDEPLYLILAELRASLCKPHKLIPDKMILVIVSGPPWCANAAKDEPIVATASISSEERPTSGILHSENDEYVACVLLANLERMHAATLLPVPPRDYSIFSAQAVTYASAPTER